MLLHARNVAVLHPVSTGTSAMRTAFPSMLLL
jgi:hypothetical protein